VSHAPHAHRVVAGAFLFVVFTPVFLHAQPRFDAASIKPNTSGTGGGATFQSGGRFLARNASLRTLIAVAYGDPVALDRSRIVGAPAALDADRFDIEAKASTEFPELQAAGDTETGKAMLRALLEDRFKLAAHWETRAIPVFALVRRNEARMSPRLVPSPGSPGKDCTPAGAPAADPPLPRCGSYLLQNAGGNEFGIHARGITMTSFARNLQNVAGRVVVDKTGIDGTFNFDLDFELRTASTGGSDDGLGPAIFTAVQEQLELKLEATAAPVSVLVVDSASRPSED